MAIIAGNIQNFRNWSKKIVCTTLGQNVMAISDVVSSYSVCPFNLVTFLHEVVTLDFSNFALVFNTHRKDVFFLLLFLLAGVDWGH